MFGKRLLPMCSRLVLQHAGTRRWVGQQVSSLVYKEYGDPQSVLQLQTCEQSNLQQDQVRIQVMAAPVNPADINTIQGVYPVKPKLPAVGGNEGVGQVTEVGSKVTGVKVGDWVIPDAAALGTWTSEMVISDSEVMKIDKDLGLDAAATIAVNPCTAYRMLHDFGDLKSGDVVIQNGANSAVGQAVIQIARHLGVHTVNVVRDRPDISELRSQLTALGGSCVVTEEEMRQGALKEFFSSHGSCRLAFNCVGGKQGGLLLKYLQAGGKMITYGAMSRQPLSVPAGPLIFSDVSLHGFWMTQWNKKNRNTSQRRTMIDFISKLIKDGHLKTPVVQYISIENYKQTMAKSMEGGNNVKYVFKMT